MKVLHLSSFDIVGGAARAAYRIHTRSRNIRRRLINLTYSDYKSDAFAKSLL